MIILIEVLFLTGIEGAEGADCTDERTEVESERIEGGSEREGEREGEGISLSLLIGRASE